MTEPHPLRPSRLNGHGLHVERDRGDRHPLLDELLGVELSWVTDEALCAQADPESFWPEQGSPAVVALEICQRCPLIDPCKSYGMTHAEFGGVWGGTTSTERRRTRRRRAA